MRFRRKPRLSPSDPPSQSQLEVTVSGTGGGGDFARAVEEMRKAMSARPGIWSLPELPAPAPVFPQEQRDEPVRALKAAWLILRPDGVAFSPLNCSDGSQWYGPQSVAECHCEGTVGMFAAAGYAPSLFFPGIGLDLGKPHPVPGPRTSCGFYAWKPDVPFPWQAGTWLLETDLYGRVIEHKQGYRAQKQRVLSVSPVPSMLCDQPARLVADMKTGRIMADCDSCPASECHPVSADRLRKWLGVEVDMARAWKLREGAQ
jgi:hypothetical protein